MATPQHNGAVFVHKGKNHWKESWLSLEPNGKLTWRKKDAYVVKGAVYMEDIFNQIQINGWSEKKCTENKGVTAFLIRLPIEIRGSKTKVTLIVKSGEDLDLWLDAFATVVGKWKLWKTVKQRQAAKVAKQMAIDGDHVERLLKYEQLVEFYKIAWTDFLESRKKKEIGEEKNLNGHMQNGTSHQSNGHQNGTPTRPMQIANKENQSIKPAPVISNIQEKVSSTSNGVPQVNGTIIRHAKTPEEIYGEEDDGEELHF